LRIHPAGTFDVFPGCFGEIPGQAADSFPELTGRMKGREAEVAAE